MAGSCLFFDQFQKCFGITGCIRNGSFGLFNSNYLNSFWQRNLPGRPAAPAKITAEAASLSFFVENRRDKRPAPASSSLWARTMFEKRLFRLASKAPGAYSMRRWRGIGLAKPRFQTGSGPFFGKSCCLAGASAQGGLISSAKPAPNPCKTGGSMPRKGQVPRAEPQQFMQKQPHCAHGGSREGEKQC